MWSTYWIGLDIISVCVCTVEYEYIKYVCMHIMFVFIYAILEIEMVRSLISSHLIISHMQYIQSSKINVRTYHIITTSNISTHSSINGHHGRLDGLLSMD